MIREIRFHEAAAEELSAAFDWYQARSERAAARFFEEIAHTVERIAQSSRQFPHLPGSTHRALVSRFPFAVVFRETAAGIEVIAVAHARRRPGYWRNRVPPE